jgi:sulfocyanin
MKRIWIPCVVLSATLTACSGGTKSPNQMQGSQPGQASAAEQPSSAQAAPQTDASEAPMTTPDWFAYDKEAKTVRLTITAGLTPTLNHWNFNGGTNGDMIITVPLGSKVTLDFKNADPALAHTLGIVSKVGGYSATPTMDPVFDGAASTPHTATAGVPAGQSQTLHFTASKAGHYAAICYMAGHAAAGMWIHFNVSSTGEAGVQSVAAE